MTLLLACLLLLLPPLNIPPAQPIRVYLAVPPGQTVAAADVQRADQIAHAALAFWSAHHPERPRFDAPPIRIVHTPQPNTLAWLEWVDSIPQDMPTIIVVANRDPFFLLAGADRSMDGMALAQSAVVVLEPRRLPWTAEATLTHELGHILYHLPDLYDDGPCTDIDLMCNDEQAYHANWLGCQTLATLGGGCKTHYLPIVGHEPDSPCLRLYHPNAARRSVSPCVASTRRPATTRGTGGSIPQ